MQFSSSCSKLLFETEDNYRKSQSKYRVVKPSLSGYSTKHCCTLLGNSVGERAGSL